MNIRETIFDILKKDYPLRKKIAETLGIREATVGVWIYRKQHGRIGSYLVVKIIKDHTGFSDEEIFDNETELFIKKIQDAQSSKIVSEIQKSHS